MIKAIIFDLDGTTVDSRTTWTQTFDSVATKYGFSYSEELEHLTRGVGVIKASEKLTDHYGIPEKREEFLALAKETFVKHFDKNVVLMDGAEELLGSLFGKYRLALASSSPRFVIEANFTKFPKLRGYFETSVAGDEVENTKPSPDIFLLAAKKLEVATSVCLVIEDSPTGVAAAKAANMRCIGLLDPGPKKQNLSKADVQVETLSEITPEIISEL